MAGISSLGVGSNLQLSDLLDKLAEAERVPLAVLQKQQAAYKTKLSAYGSIKSLLTSFQATAKSLAKLETFGAVKAQVSNADIMGVTAGNNAVPGDLSVSVTRLASNQSLAGAGQVKQDVAIGTGTITFDFGVTTGYDDNPASPTYGTYVNPTFTPTADASKTVTIAAGSNSLQGIRDAINKANIGVKASIINDGSGAPYRLILNSEKTGEAMSMRISGSSPELQGLVGYDPVAGPQPGGMKETVRATNAALTVNGIAITSASNTVTDAAQGMTMTLKKTGSTSVSVTQDSEAIKNAVQAMVTAYNNGQAADSLRCQGGHQGRAEWRRRAAGDPGIAACRAEHARGGYAGQDAEHAGADRRVAAEGRHDVDRQQEVRCRAQGQLARCDRAVRGRWHEGRLRTAPVRCGRSRNGRKRSAGQRDNRP